MARVFDIIEIMRHVMLGFRLLLAAGLLCLPAAVQAQTTLEKVRAQGFVQCGSVPRPGLAQDDGKGDWKGLEVQMCRAVAIAALGRDARFAYHEYGSDKDFDIVRAGADQVSFISFSEMMDQKLTDKLLPGPTVFIETHDLLVANASPSHHFAELAGQSVCSLAGTAANTSLDAWFESRDIPLARYPFSEDGEMYDAFRVQRCKAVAGEATALAEARLDRGINRIGMRFVDEHLKTFPIVAATPLKEDAQWAAIVAWTVHTVMAADTTETHWRPSGLRAMQVEGTGLGLSPDWQRTVVDTVGNYAAIFRRTLGADSALKLDQGLNAPIAGNGVLVVPATD